MKYGNTSNARINMTLRRVRVNICRGKATHSERASVALVMLHAMNMRRVTRWFKYDREWFFFCNHNWHLLAHVSLQRTPLTRAGGRVEVVASLSQGRTTAALCGLFTHKSVPVIFEPPCTLPSMACLDLPYFSTLPQKREDFQGEGGLWA